MSRVGNILFACLVGSLSIQGLFASLTPYLSIYGELSANLDGGFKRGTGSGILSELGLDWQSEDSNGWSAQVDAQWYTGDDLSGNEVGDFLVFSNLIRSEGIRLNRVQFGYQNEEKRFGWKVGLLLLDDDFMSSDYAALFANSAFGPLATVSANLLAPIFPLSAPGLWMGADVSESWFLQAGIYAGNAGDDLGSNHGFGGKIKSGDGAVVFVEGVYAYLASAGTGTVKVGGHWHSGAFERFSDGRTEEGNGGLHMVIDHPVASDVYGETTTGVFLRIGVSPDESLSTVTFAADAGINWKGLLPYREEDVCGIGIAYAKFGEEYLESIRFGGSTVTDKEWVIEGSYTCVLSESVSLQPYLQFIFDPHFSSEDATLAGIRISIEM
jgi:porin